MENPAFLFPHHLILTLAASGYSLNFPIGPFQRTVAAKPNRAKARFSKRTLALSGSQSQGLEIFYALLFSFFIDIRIGPVAFVVGRLSWAATAGSPA